MNVLLAILLFIASCSQFVIDKCTLLRPGNYLMKSSITARSSQLTIDNNTYKISESSKSPIKGKIEWLEGCRFKLESPTDSYNEVTRQLNSLGPVIYEISNKSRDTIIYKVTRGLHITIDEGVLVRTKSF